MNIKLAGKAAEVFRRLNEMKEQEESGGGVIYEGERHQNGDVWVSRIKILPMGSKINGIPANRIKQEPLEPGPSQSLYNHSPDGFEWGYSGSGPAQLALALVLDAIGDKDIALKYHQDFKERFVAGWGKNWSINADQVRRFILLKEEYFKNGREENV